VRVLYLNHNVAGTGTYQRAVNLAGEVAARGHEVTLVTTSPTQRLRGTERTVDGVRIMETPDLLIGGARNGWDPWNTGWRLHRLRNEAFDLIHAFDCRPVVIGPALAQRRRTGAVLFIDWADWWGRGGTIDERSGWLLRTFFGPIETWFEEAFRGDAVANTTISGQLRERCIGLGIEPQRVCALPNGCRAPAPPRDSAAARRRRGVGGNPLIVHLGVASSADTELLFSAFRQVRAVRPDVQLALLGRFRGAVPADLRGAVRVTGYLSEDALADWLAAADVAVVPLRDTLSNRARWPGKVNEYLSAGVPVVLPAVGEAAARVAEAGAGLGCAATASGVAEALMNVLENPDARAAMAAAARILAGDALSWRRIGDELLDFYERWLPHTAAASKGAAKVAC
jgi:glycosyltransferase involved in cell wall biosynthesis